MSNQSMRSIRRSIYSAKHLVRVSNEQVSNFSFVLYLAFLIDFFLHMSARIPGYASIRPTLVLVILIIIALIFQRTKLAGRSANQVFSAIIALIVYLIVSLPFVEFPGSVLRENAENFVKAVVFFFFTVYFLDTDKRLRIFLFVFIACQVFRVLEPLYLHVTDGYWGDRTYIGGGEFTGRLGGAPADIINPNELGFVIITIIPFLHYLLFGLGKIRSLIYLLLVPCLFYALILTMSRGAFLALFVVAWMIFRESTRKIALIITAVMIAVGGWNVMTPIQQDRYLSLVDSETVGAATLQGRINGMVSEIQLGLVRPIVGHGLGTTQEAKYHSYGGTYQSHNMYSELLIEIGIIGAIFFLRYMYQIRKRIKKNVEFLRSLQFPEWHFYSRLNKSLNAVFWMYVVFSFNYWGLSVYYWYLLGGLVTSFAWLLKAYDVSQLKDGVNARM